MKSSKTILAIICMCALALFAACGDDNQPLPEDDEPSFTTLGDAQTLPASTQDTQPSATASDTEPPPESLPVGGDSTETIPPPTSTKPPVTSTKAPVTSTAKSDGAVYPPYAQKYAYAGYTPMQTKTQPWYLMLLNGKYCLPEGYEVNTAEAGNGTYLDRRVVPAFDKMYAAAKAAGHTLTPQSGWRRLSRQTSNLDASIASWQNQGYSKVDATRKALELIMLPGCSEHNAGLAMDIVTWDPNAHFEKTAAFAWLMEHGADYGFILRYPKDKTAITGVSF
ncbi:MAG: D-alanyl-D-alanine carboxypeptidase family protein [Oscillospiraceae bacterium]|jgi:LAS superfamily LD-carboxypeptidase LdcB|nr:D-alanyl-D-alanine carboxypeptidase family protein [Oscillospiraceae bacterium]